MRFIGAGGRENGFAARGKKRFVTELKAGQGERDLDLKSEVVVTRSLNPKEAMGFHHLRSCLLAGPGEMVPLFDLNKE